MKTQACLALVAAIAGVTAACGVAQPSGEPRPSVVVPSVTPEILAPLTSVVAPSAAPVTLAPLTSTVVPSATPEILAPMAIDIARDESGEPSIFNYCSPIITDTDPPLIARECAVPESPYLFIGYGSFAASQGDLDAEWQSETWAMYFDGQAVDLSKFGVFDVDWEGNRLRQWKVALYNPTPGAHTLRYVIGRVDGTREPTDVTWRFTIGASSSQSTPAETPQAIAYPALSSNVAYGQTPYSSATAGLNFLLYIPASFGKDPQQRWPLILYLHGSGDRGSNLDYLKTGGLPKRLEGQDDFPAIVLSPQGNGEYEFWSTDEMVQSLLSLLDEVQASYPIDPNRLYLTGVSAGGEATWEIGLRYPDLFAALAPVAGYYGYPFAVPEDICALKNVPIWAFHGAADETVPVNAEETLVQALRGCAGDVQFTVYPDAGHDIANDVYASAELYAWLFSQALK